MKRFFLLIGLLGVFGVSGWYYWTVRSYLRWFDNHLIGTVWTAAKEKELAEILCQPFHYCGHGSTSKAFVSEDGRFVIKTFLKEQFVSKKFQNIPFISDLANRKRTLKSKYDRSFGPIYAYQYIPKESGMIYYQLIKPRDLFHNSVRLVDQDGSVIEMDLNKSEFIIQKKSVVVSEYLIDHLARGELEKVKEGISKLLRMTQTLYDQGIVLVVLQFLDNFGFIEDEPIRIDVEHVRYDPEWKETGKRHLRKELSIFRRWIEKNAPPEIVDHFDSETKELFF